jgi:biopolymer transport protein ExbB
MLGETRRSPLTFLNGAQTEDLVDFPVLVRLTPDRIDYDYVLADGSNIRFFDADGQTLLSHEVESFDRGGTSLFWVRVPRIDAGSNSDFIWLTYGGGGAAAGPPAAVWSNGYRGVWHMNGSGSCPDSSGFGNHGADNPTLATAGRIGGARFFDGSDDYIDCGDDPSLAITGAVTVSAWVKPAADPYPVMRVLSKKSAWDGPTGYALAVYPQLDEVHHVSSGGWPFGVGLPPNVDTGWHLVAGTTNGTTAAIYWDGAAVTSQSGTFVLAAGVVRFSLGRITGAADFFYGAVDEVRVSSVARSPAWIRAQYLSTADLFISYGPDEEAP